MIRQMRLKFIGIAMMAVILMIFTILLTINLFMTNLAKDQVEGYLGHAILNHGRIDAPSQEGKGPVKDPGLAPIVTGVSMMLSEEGQLIDVLHNSEEMEEETMAYYGQLAINGNEESATIDNYMYRIKKEKSRWILVLANTSVQDEMLNGLLQISYIISGISVIALLAFISLLSKYITKPVEVAFEKQKRFISDSSHELKTPLSVMSANLDMLQMEIGENHRIDAIGGGIHRMNGLIHELLTLVRSEQSSRIMTDINLSELVEGVILPMEVVAFEKSNRIEYKINPNIHLIGDEEGLRKMVGVLLDNAIKYARENTSIQVSLYLRAGHKVIEVFNEGIGLEKDQQKRVFDKFYRVDDARQRATGGYGIGLSIVDSVVKAHKGKIIIDSVPDDYIVFRVTLP